MVNFCRIWAALDTASSWSWIPEAKGPAACRAGSEPSFSPKQLMISQNHEALIDSHKTCRVMAYLVCKMSKFIHSYHSSFGVAPLLHSDLQETPLDFIPHSRLHRLWVLRRGHTLSAVCVQICFQLSEAGVWSNYLCLSP